ncbi:MAG TPA: ABC transporter permease [Pyrinomonadaceae bacterium]|nr:ABC transporter permease [Pyrinomonadaceae bacterium]
MRKELGTFILLVVLCVVVAVYQPAFLGGTNLQNMARLIGMYGIFSIGVGVVIITGGIDLSVGSMFALLGVLLSMMLASWHWPPVLAIVAVMCVAVGLGLVHGLLVTRLRVQPFIVTLCGLLFYRGLARFIADDETKGFGTGQGFEWLTHLATGSLFGIPAPFILLVVIAAVMWVVLHRSIYGRYLFAVGRNEEAARYSGINARKIVASAYVVSGLTAGISGILLAFYTNSVSPSSHGNFFELYGIAAAVLGGCSLRGGEGSVVGIMIGTALLQVLQNLVNLLGIPSSLNFAVMGAVILIGVIADQLLKRQRPLVAARESAGGAATPPRMAAGGAGD